MKPENVETRYNKFRGLYDGDYTTTLSDHTEPIQQVKKAKHVEASFKIDNYKELKNYIHNYLGLTKEEIKKMVWDTVVETVNKEVNKCLNDKERIKSIIEGQIKFEIMRDHPRRSYIHSTMDEIYNKIDSTIHEEVIKRLRIELKEPEDE